MNKFKLQIIHMLSKNQLGFLYMFMSICAFSLMDVIVKWSVNFPIGQVLFFRGFFGIVFYFFVIPRERLHNFYQTSRPGLHALRCLSGLIALVAFSFSASSIYIFNDYMDIKNDQKHPKKKISSSCSGFD